MLLNVSVLCCSFQGTGKPVERDCLVQLKLTLHSHSDFNIRLFRERLSDKVQATTSKGIVGGFKFTVFQRNLIEWQERPWTYVCEC